MVSKYYLWLLHWYLYFEIRKVYFLFQFTSVNLPVDVLRDGEKNSRPIRRSFSRMESQSAAMHGPTQKSFQRWTRRRSPVQSKWISSRPFNTSQPRREVCPVKPGGTCPAFFQVAVATINLPTNEATNVKYSILSLRWTLFPQISICNRITMSNVKCQSTKTAQKMSYFLYFK